MEPSEKYSISELEKLSGVKAHTIRIWEKRYQLINPRRTETNIRYYLKEDLTKLLRVSILNNNGYKISSIANFDDTSIKEKVENLISVNDDIENFIDYLVVTMINMDELQFEKEVAKLVHKLGFEDTIVKVIYPFLNKIGVLWINERISPAQEHFITHLIRQKIISAIDRIPLKDTYYASFILYLPDKELHELGLLFCYYIAKKSGFKVYYLGQTVPIDDVIKVTKIHNPQYIVTSFTNSISEKQIEKHVHRIANAFKQKTIFVMGHQAKVKLKNIPSNVQKIDDVKVFKEILDGMIR